MRVPFTLIAILCVFATLRAQDTIRGIVLDAATHEGLPGAIILTGNGGGTSSSLDGSFVLISYCDSIEFRLIGYKSLKTKPTKGSKLRIELPIETSAISEVVVTASRYLQHRDEVPMSIDKVSAGVIQETKAVGLQEIINKVPGVVMMNLNNEQHGMSIRQPMGTSPYYLYMEDGIPLRTMGVFNHNALLEMNLLSISSLEVVKGPASSLYGPEAVGGAINFITNRPSAVLTAKAGLQADNFGYKRLQFNAGGPLSKKIGFSVGGFSAQQKNSWMQYSDYDKSSVNARADYAISAKTNLVIAGAYNQYYSQTPGSTDSTAFFSRSYRSAAQFTYRQVTASRIRATLSHRWNEKNVTTATVFHRVNNLRQNPAYGIKWIKGATTAKGEINLNQFTSNGGMLQHVVDVAVVKTKLVGGLSVDVSPVKYEAHQLDLAAVPRTGGNSVEYYSILNERTEIQLSHYEALLYNSAAYLQAEMKPVKKLTLVFGGRYDDMRFSYTNYLDGNNGFKSFHKMTPKAGATYKTSKSSQVFVNYSLGFCPPSLTTIFSKKPGTESSFYYDLQPATFTNYEFGGWSSFLGNKLTFSYAVYQLNGTNELLNVRQPDNSTVYESAGKTLHRGIEYNIVYHLSPSWMVRTGGSNAVHRYEKFTLSAKSTDVLKNVDGKTMPGAPANIVNSEIMFRARFIKGLRLSMEWQYLSSWYTDQVNSTRYEERGAFDLKGISVLNFRTGFERGPLEIFCNILNLSDELYAHNATRGNTSGSPVAYTPAAPRTFIFGIQYSFVSKK